MTKDDQKRFRGKGFHLTYKHWLPMDLLKDYVSRVVLARSIELKRTPAKLLWWSCVHERGHANKDPPYDHTHIAFKLSGDKPLDMKGCRCFDYLHNGEVVHPNIQCIQNVQHERVLYNDYHRKEPILLLQSEEKPSKVTTIEAILLAPSLAEAVQLANIEIRSVSDINILRNAPPALERFQHNFSSEDCEWTVKINNPNWKVLFIWGLTDMGKTQFALSLFENPLLVRARDTLRRLNMSFHDGFICDDMSFLDLPYESIIHLLDSDEEGTVPCRYSPAIIPRDTRRVFTSNKPFQQVFGDDAHGALRRRVDQIIHITGKCYKPRVAPATNTLLRDIRAEVPVQEEAVPCANSPTSVAELDLNSPPGGMDIDAEEDLLNWLATGDGNLGYNYADNFYLP